MIDQASRLRQLVVGGNPGTASPDVRHPAGSVPNTRVVAVTSGKGGVGKTTCAINLAYVLAGSGRSVLLVDADLGLANVDIMLGIEPARHIGHLLLPEFSPEDAETVGPGGIRVITGGSGLRELADAAQTERLMLLEKLRSHFGRFQWVIIDTSPGIGADVVDFLKEADQILVVTTPEPASLQDTYAAIKTIARHVSGADVRPIINMASRGEQAEAAVSALNEVAGRFLGRRYDRWHRIDSDPLVSRAAAARQPFVRLYPRSPAAVSLRLLARSLAGSQAQSRHFGG